MNYATTQEHVPVIKPVIRTVKEKFRDLYHILPYKSLPKVMVQYGVKDVVKCINIYHLTEEYLRHTPQENF